MEVSDQPYAPATLTLGEEAPITLAGPHSRSRHLEREEPVAPAGNQSTVPRWPSPCPTRYSVSTWHVPLAKTQVRCLQLLAYSWGHTDYHLTILNAFRTKKRTASSCTHACPTTATPIRTGSAYFLFRNWLKCVHILLAIPAMMSFLSFSNR